MIVDKPRISDVWDQCHSIAFFNVVLLISITVVWLDLFYFCNRLYSKDIHCVLLTNLNHFFKFLFSQTYNRPWLNMYINHLPASHLSMTSSPETTILTSCACLFLFLVLELATPAASSKSMGPFIYYVSPWKGEGGGMTI